MSSPVLLSQPLLSHELLANYQRIATQPLTVIDVETTGARYAVGADGKGDRVIEISLLQGTLESGILQQQTHLINPGVEIPERIIEFTGITPEMLKGAAEPQKIWPLYLPLLSEGILTAHNIRFDFGFVAMELGRLGTSFVCPPPRRLCTVELSRLLLSHLPSRRLPALVRHFKFPVEESHRAEADTVACWLLAQKLLTEILEGAEEDLLAKFGRQPLILSAAAKILGCSQEVTRGILEAAEVRPLYTSRSGAVFYRRSYVEEVYRRRLEEQTVVQGELDLLEE